ncbi:MAG: 23S rRNA (uracil(747)-C(5))-methyltransferase RlmC [Pasteurellaceae bacterium]|nr:23S rRNA (uracil(747)-C(5))-methyltransferase RlmC [Pasteurellaceae bacterium]
MQETMSCRYFAQGNCTSCQWLTYSYSHQIVTKLADLKGVTSAYFLPKTELLPTVTSPISQCRNKAKMVVSGSVERPILGILPDRQQPQSGVDLSTCPLYPAQFEQYFALLKQFIGRAGLVPYNVATKRGELKYILLTQSEYNQALLIRFVLKSEQKRPLIERELAPFLAKLPPDSVVSLNIQPQHSAILEGEKEIILTKAHAIEERWNGIPLYIRPQSFFQTNPKVAAQLYATAQQWVADLPVKHLWDLFCGVGGFGLHCLATLQASDPLASLTGIEISPAAIDCAKRSAAQLHLNHVTFASLDAAQFALNQHTMPDLVIVNPPRRGLGMPLATFLNTLGSTYLLYSSCNAQSMANDLAYLTEYELLKIQLFDMFPHTAHYEVLALLQKKEKETHENPSKTTFN